MSRASKFVLTTLIALAIAGGLLWSFQAHRAELAGEAESDQAIGSSAQVTRGPGGEVVVKFDRQMQQRVDIRTQVLAAVTRRRQVLAYGHLEEDPSRSFVVRAPMAGTVAGTAGRPWPDLGEMIAGGSSVGMLEPRLAAADRITLADRLASAKGDVESGKAALAASQAALDRTRVLNADDKNVSDRALQQAQALAASDQARLAAAQESVRLIESSLGSARDGAIPLLAQRGGQVVEVTVHPGESVESGQAILRLAQFDRLLARVTVPAGEAAAVDASTADVLPLGLERPIRAQRVAIADAIDPKLQGQPLLFRVANPSLLLRPGLSVTAYLEAPGPARRGVTVPQSAVVRQSGTSWVYVQIGADRFARRAVGLEEPVGDGWFTRSLSPGDRVVTTGAQTLLSEEFKSQIQVGDEDQQ
ncbi:MAG: efflux RND transporter periplasmic adaptor subunit [Bryobacteraceae bacterium]